MLDLTYYPTKLLPKRSKHSSAHLTYYFLLTFSILYLLFNTFYHLDANLYLSFSASFLLFFYYYLPFFFLTWIYVLSITIAFLHFDLRSHTNSYRTSAPLPPLVTLQPLAFSIVHIRALIGCFCCCLSLGHLRRPGKGRQPPHSLWCHHHAPPRLSINPHLWLCVSETRFNRER